ncbi:MAG: hypothetical protein JSV64_01765, partial [Candidatus Bathyarchaeota archaeon]
ATIEPTGPKPIIPIVGFFPSMLKPPNRVLKVRFIYSPFRLEFHFQSIISFQDFVNEMLVRVKLEQP